MGPVERANLVAYLGLISQRLFDVEARLKSKSNNNESSAKPWLEFSKVVLGGWPAFGLLFLLLFYAPVRDAINAIPDRVKSADEIGVLGVSLKGSIKVEAEKLGSIQLSETLPTLTPAAVEFLLRGTPDYNALVASVHESNLLKAIWLPSEQTLRILEELEAKKLITIQGILDRGDDNVSTLRQAIADFKKTYQVREEGYTGTDQIRLELVTPTKVSLPGYNWRPTELGKNAINVILSAVSAQLAPQVRSRDSAAK